MTEAIAATPGWVEAEVEAVFGPLPSSLGPVREAFLECLAGRKAPAAPSDLLGAEFEPCHGAVRRALAAAGVGEGESAAVLARLDAIEARIAGES